MAKRLPMSVYINRMALFEMLNFTYADFKIATGLSKTQVIHATKKVTKDKNGAYDAVMTFLYYKRSRYNQRKYFRNLYEYVNKYLKPGQDLKEFLSQFQETLDHWMNEGIKGTRPTIPIFEWYHKMKAGYEFMQRAIRTYPVVDNESPFGLTFEIKRDYLLGEPIFKEDE